MANWFQNANSAMTAGATGTQDMNNNVNGYSYAPNGTGGVDYFKLQDNAAGTASMPVPITREEYARGTGEDPNSIEQNAYLSMQDQMDAGQVANASGNNGDGTPLNSPEQNPGGTGGGTAPDVYTPHLVYGEWSYSPEQETEIVNRQIEKVYQDTVGKIEQSFKRGFLTIDQRDEEIKKTRTDLIKKKEEDLQSVSGYFNSIAPDAIQSGRGKLEGQSVQDYTTNNKQLGSELGSNLYGADGRIRQDLSAQDLSPYMNENSDTGNLARSIGDMYSQKQTAMNTAGSSKNTNIDANANDYITNKGVAGSDYSNYLNANILNQRAPGQVGSTGPALVKKLDKYGNPIDEWANQ